MKQTDEELEKAADDLLQEWTYSRDNPSGYIYSETQLSRKSLKKGAKEVLYSQLTEGQLHKLEGETAVYNKMSEEEILQEAIKECGLTKQQEDVIRLQILGYTQEETAIQLGITQQTVSEHIQIAQKKLQHYFMK